MNDTNEFHDLFGEFDGRFYFTNPFDTDFSALWNNKEYYFPAKKTVPLVILGEPLESIQEIRKRFAYRLAEREWYNGKEYKRLSKMGNGLPPTFNEAELEPFIDQCLKPLPMDRVRVREVTKEKIKISTHTKALGESEDPAELFREENKSVRNLGKMPERAL